jgi:S1-C subfamily serine protease
VLYATAENGPGGVRVLDVIAGSPAEQAGFSASPQPSPQTAQVLTAVVSVLMELAPVAVLAMALDFAPNADSRQPEEWGDLIIAVAGQPVRDALEFNDVMGHFGPGDTVTFVVRRGRTQVRLSAQLAADP